MAATLLVIDDNDLDFERIERGLKKLGADVPVRRALDGRDGLTVLHEMATSESGKPLAILLDLNMPRMNGLEFLEVVRADPTLCDTPVFFVSTSDRPDDVEKARELGVRGYLVKPVKKDELRELLASLEESSTKTEEPTA